MSQNEKLNFDLIQGMLSPSITIYKELVQNQFVELGFDPKKFWIDNALITTYDYIRMCSHNNLAITSGVSPSTR